MVAGFRGRFKREKQSRQKEIEGREREICLLGNDEGEVSVNYSELLQLPGLKATLSACKSVPSLSKHHHACCSCSEVCN